MGFGGQKLCQQIIYNFYTRNVHVYFQIQILIYKDFSSSCFSGTLIMNEKRTRASTLHVSKTCLLEKPCSVVLFKPFNSDYALQVLHQ